MNQSIIDFVENSNKNPRTPALRKISVGSMYTTLFHRKSTNLWYLSNLGNFKVAGVQAETAKEVCDLNDIHYHLEEPTRTYSIGNLQGLGLTNFNRWQGLVKESCRGCIVRQASGYICFSPHPSDWVNAKAKRSCVSRKIKEIIQLADKAEDADDKIQEFVDKYAEITCGKMFSILEEKGIDHNWIKADCDHWTNDTASVSGGGEVCQFCLGNHYTYMDQTDEYHATSDLYYWDDEWQFEPEPEPEEEDSLMDYSTNVLDFVKRDYSFTPGPNTVLLMGVELEMITRGNINDSIDSIRDYLDSDYCVFKRDGSIGDSGIEMVTAPRKLTDHVKLLGEWKPGSELRAWNSKVCGMHVHIDSRAFTPITLGRFMVFINHPRNAAFIRRLAGRHPMQDHNAHDYCRAESQEDVKSVAKARKAGHCSRYRMVNLMNLGESERERLGVEGEDSGQYNTVELRIFRATLKKERLLAQLEFTQAVVMFCRETSNLELSDADFLKWLGKRTKKEYPNLLAWYGISKKAVEASSGEELDETTCVYYEPPKKEVYVPPASVIRQVESLNQRYGTQEPAQVPAGPEGKDQAFADLEARVSNFADLGARTSNFAAAALVLEGTVTGRLNLQTVQRNPREVLEAYEGLVHSDITRDYRLVFNN